MLHELARRFLMLWEDYLDGAALEPEAAAAAALLALGLVEPGSREA